jgi:DNA-binding CsgD family transcriptional regulator
VNSRRTYILVYGLALGIVLIAFKLFEYSVYSRDIGVDVYGAVIAVTFLGVGVLVGLKSRRPSGGRGDRRQSGGSAVSQPGPGDRVASSRRNGGYRTPPIGLSDRELEVLSHVASGKTNNQIAEALFLSPNTVKSHVSSIFRKLDVERRAHAVARAKELELIN